MFNFSFYPKWKILTFWCVQINDLCTITHATLAMKIDTMITQTFGHFIRINNINRVVRANFGSPCLTYLFVETERQSADETRYGINLDVYIRQYYLCTYSRCRV